MYDEVLVPTDGSPTAENAVEHALDLARRHEAALHALYVVDVGQGPPTGQAELWAPVVQAVRNQGNLLTGEIVEAAVEAGLEACQAVEEHDTAAEGVLSYAEEQEIDVLVIGTHGRSGPKRWLLGSVAERVLRGSTVPVLAVPPDKGEA